MRFDIEETFAWVNEAWANSTESVNHCDADGDEPSWIANDVTLPDDITRYVEGMDGALAVRTGKSGDRVLQRVDLHGDVTGTLPIADEATTATWTELRFTSFDEFGVPQPMTSGATSNAPPARYGWLGGAQRSADTPTGVILMGVRLYHQDSLVRRWRSLTRPLFVLVFPLEASDLLPAAVPDQDGVVRTRVTFDPRAAGLAWARRARRRRHRRRTVGRAIPRRAGR